MMRLGLAARGGDLEVSKEDQARDEVRSLIRRYQNEGKLEGHQFEDLDYATRSRLYSTAESEVDGATDPYDAARIAIRKGLGIGQGARTTFPTT